MFKTLKIKSVKNAYRNRKADYSALLKERFNQISAENFKRHD